MESQTKAIDMQPFSQDSFAMPSSKVSTTFMQWYSQLNIKKVDCVRTMQDALIMLLLLEKGNPKNILDGVSYLDSFKPKKIFIGSPGTEKVFLQATIKRTQDLITGIYFPCDVTEVCILYTPAHGFRSPSGRRSGKKTKNKKTWVPVTMKNLGDGEYEFPTPISPPPYGKLSIAIRLDREQIEENAWFAGLGYIPFSIRNVTLKEQSRKELRDLREERIIWNHSIALDFLSLLNSTVTAFSDVSMSFEENKARHNRILES